MNSKILLRLPFILLCFLLQLFSVIKVHSQAVNTPVRIAVAQLTHGHVVWILSRKKPDVVLAGIYYCDIKS